MKAVKILLTLAAALSATLYVSSPKTELDNTSFASIIASKKGSGVKFYGVEIKVSDISRAAEFYGETMGFGIKNQTSDEAWLETQNFPVKLTKAATANRIDFESETHAKIAFMANSLLLTIDQLRSKNVQFHPQSLSRNGIGIGITFEDPFGNRHSLVEVQVRDVPNFAEPRIYNTGFAMANMDLARDFYVDGLGFEVYSEDYLPDALPLKHADNSFAFMLHYNKDLLVRQSNEDQSQVSLIFSTPDLESSMGLLKSAGATLIAETQQFSTSGYYIRFVDPLGNESLLLQPK